MMRGGLQATSQLYDPQSGLCIYYLGTYSIIGNEGPEAILAIDIERSVDDK